MMKSIIAALLVSTLLPDWAAANEDDKSETSTVRIQGGKLVGEKHEIEIYDYHTGTYQTVDVYRQPAETGKNKPESTLQKQPARQAPRQ